MTRCPSQDWDLYVAQMEGTQMMDDSIYEEIENELYYQAERWGVEADDTKNEPNDWVSYISHHSSRWFKGGFAPYDEETVNDFRRQMLKTACLAISAMQSLDRQRKAGGAPFYQKRASSKK